jgi:transposase InsO family protein
MGGSPPFGEHRFARLMRAEGIRAKTVKKGRATTQSNHRMPVAANTLNRQFSVTRQNWLWAGDITYVWTTEGWLYLAVVLDLYFPRAVIGWALEARFTGDLTQQALTMAIRHQSRVAAPLGSGQPVCRHGIPATAHDTRDDRQHVEAGELLG